LSQHPKAKGLRLATIAGTQSENKARKKALKHLVNGIGRTHGSSSHGEGFELCHLCKHPERENGKEKKL